MASPACRFGGGAGAGGCVAGAPGGWRWAALTSSPRQVFGMVFTCCLYKSLKLEHY